ncbi:hypothetical protein Osc7112_4998 [Oscillatoria nigro-viridis PCC 7112]|uniref:Uncharacterized protein n=1 Tax=Phormidium nigroviride PCC 7112 TaxID=179408 RepID=K9VNY2_9CYAN|nr:hypothetical protein [Oscillatoria nigro-viridis]AFZ09264.1 hypothetical protein Osc7112_4998 [Oscillatoria nigro-viridis PCC 7112]
MTEPPQIKNPSITLYPFHLRDDSDEGYGQVARNAQSLWENLADNVGKEFNINELKSLRDKLICYKDGLYYPDGEQENLTNGKLLIPDGGKTLKFPQIIQPDHHKLDGSIYALRIHDTYTADLTFYYQNATIKVADLTRLNPQGCLLPNAIQPSLGQTLLLYAEPAVYDTYRKLADESVKAFVQDKQPSQVEFRAEGKLFGSPIFEYDSREDDATKRCHFLVWLQENSQTLKFATPTFNSYLMNLLCSRAKIVFVYGEARKKYRKAQQIVSELEKKLPEFSQIEREQDRQVKLQKLKQLLAEIRIKMFDCTQQVRYLQEDRNTIDTNAENYGDALTKIKGLSIPGDNLDFLKKFLDLAENKYQRQIEIDFNYLIASQDLFQQSISTVRGMVEIEQVELDREQMELYKQKEEEEKKRDRQLENIIFFVGTAIGGGQIFSAAYPLIKDKPIKWQPDFSLPLHPFAATILWSLLFGLLFGLLMLGIAVWVRKTFLR